MRHFVFLIALIIAFACNLPTTSSKQVLTSQEKAICDSLKIDSEVILKVREHTDSAIVPLPSNLENIEDKDIDKDSGKTEYPGLLFNSDYANSDKIIIALYNNLQKKGYTIFCIDRNFGIKDEPDRICILKSIDKYEILKQVQTDGINWDIDNDSLISIIKKFDTDYSLDLVGASGDWCEFKIKKEPKDWLTLAKQAYQVCPDIVEQGTGTVEKLATEIRMTNRLYFWWD